MVMFYPFFSRASIGPCLIFLCAVLSRAEKPEAARTLTVATCLQRAADRSPELRPGAARAEAADCRARQAERPPNPRLETEVENVAGSGAASGFDAAETTVSVAQEIELGGKRRHRTTTAQAEAVASRAEQEARRQAVLAETRQAALAVLAAQEKVRLADETLTLAREAEAAVEAREQAGKAAALETDRARADTAKVLIAYEAEKAAQREAIRNLALCWGETEPSFDFIAGAFEEAPQALPPLDDLLARASAHPEQRAYEARVRAYEARIGLERAARIPNAEVSVGGRHFQEGRDFGFVAGMSIELPLFTRNLDGVRAAEADAQTARLEADAARIRSEGRIRCLYARFSALGEQATRQREAVLPLAERSLDRIREAHRQGKAGYLDVLEARRSLIETRLALIGTLTEQRAALIELAFLSGMDLETQN